MTVAGIDIDTKRVTIAYRAGKHWRVETVPTRDAHALRDALIGARYPGGVTLACIEQPYSFAQIKNSGTYGKMSRVFGRVEEMCDLVGVDYQGVAPHVWQTAILSTRGHRMKRAELKQASMLVAAAEGAAPTNDHEADAVCIALWGATKQKMEGVG